MPIAAYLGDAGWLTATKGNLEKSSPLGYSDKIEIS